MNNYVCIYWSIWAVATVVCAIFLPTAAKIVAYDGRIGRDTIGALAVLSFFPVINVPAALFAAVVCVGKLTEHFYNEWS